MILLRMKCGLGNNMFQYAAARSQAERLHCPFAYTTYRVKWTSHIRLCLTEGRRFLRAPPFDLERWFQLEGTTPWTNQCQLLRFRCRYGLSPRRYEEPLAPIEGNIRELTRFDPDFFQIQPGTEIDGFFQSEKYFSDRSQSVRSWFQAKPEFVSLAQRLAEKTGVNPDRRCCIHVRRGDYLSMRNGTANEGWALPIDYYNNALERVPSGFKYIIISDDHEWAQNQFHHLNPLICSNADLPIVDLLLLSQCRINIIANSSFSWWGAYLNSLPNREVYYPQYFLGWAFDTELPIGISVPEWSDVPVLKKNDSTAQ